MAKSGLLPAKPQSRNTAEGDSWVSGSTTPASTLPSVVLSSHPEPVAPTEPSKRMTFDLPESLHRRIMLDCVTNGVKMTTEIRRMLEERWPASGK